MTLPVTIVIPSYGRGGLLARFLPTYLAQDCAEIVIVDDASPTSIEMEVRARRCRLALAIGGCRRV